MWAHHFFVPPELLSIDFARGSLFFRELLTDWTDITDRTDAAGNESWCGITGDWHFSRGFGFRVFVGQVRLVRFVRQSRMTGYDGFPSFHCTIEAREPFEQRGFSIIVQQPDLDHAVFRGIVKSDLQEGPLQLFRFGDAPAEIQQSELKITGQMA